MISGSYSNCELELTNLNTVKILYIRPPEIPINRHVFSDLIFSFV
jgi:hypothetical protein